MAASNKKQIRRRENPKGRSISQGGIPEQFYAESPDWRFSNSDPQMWALNQEQTGNLIWEEILPRMKSLESQTWSDILVKSNKQNHSVDVETLNKTARDRLAERYIEAESLVSLRVSGNHRLYGYMTGCTFNILWFDSDHGDNNTCVCRSYKKHT